MENEAPLFTQDWKQEKSWEFEGVEVLTAEVALPQLAGETRRTRRFNRFYRRLCRAYFLYCEQELLPYASAQCKAAMDTSAPWNKTAARMSYRVSRRCGKILSLYIDAKEESGPVPRLTLRRADTWDLGCMLPVPLCEFFPPHAHCRRRLIAFAREAAAQQMRRGIAAYDPKYRAALRRAFSARNYYLSESGLCFFYPMYAVAGAQEGIVTFTVPYDRESGPFLPPEA